MDADAARADLHTYLKHERAAVLAELDGLSEYDVRRPLTVTGTNLLGLVKHLATSCRRVWTFGSRLRGAQARAVSGRGRSAHR